MSDWMRIGAIFGNMWRMRRIVGLLILCVTCVGCTGGGSHAGVDTTFPTTTAPPTASGSSSPPRTGPLTTGPGVKPGEKPPQPSGLTTRHDLIGAQNFAVYFFEAVDWGIATTDPYLVARASTPDCKPCQTYVQTIQALSDQGGHFEGGRITVGGYKLSQGTLATADYVIDVTLDQTKATAVRPGVAPSVAASASIGTSAMVYLSWTQDRWRVVEIG